MLRKILQLSGLQNQEVRSGYEKRFENFEKLHSGSRGDTLLFVRVVATSAELRSAYELTQDRGETTVVLKTTADPKKTWPKKQEFG